LQTSLAALRLERTLANIDVVDARSSRATERAWSIRTGDLAIPFMPVDCYGDGLPDAVEDVGQTMR
jgi:hypothetical protein